MKDYIPTHNLFYLYIHIMSISKQNSSFFIWFVLETLSEELWRYYLI